MRKIPGLFAALLFFLQNPALGAQKPEVIPELRWELLQLGPQRISALEEIAAAGFEILEVDRDGSLLLLAMAGQRAWFERRGIACEVLSEDYGRQIAGENMAQARLAAADEFAAGSMVGYFSPEEIAAFVDSLIAADAHGIISERIEIGRSLWDQPIWMVRVSDNAGLDEDEPEVLYNSLIHAREGMGLMTLLYYLQYLVRNYAAADSVREVVDSRELYFVPIVTPDGYEINWRLFEENQVFGMWRKNARDNDANGELDGQDGVDLNRNFDYQWGYDDRGSSGSVNRDNYRGTSAFSEPESVVIRDFLAAREVVTSYNYHSYAEVLLNPFGYIDRLTPDSLLYMRLGKLLTRDNGYRYGNAPRALGSSYRVNGEMTDWMYGDTLVKGKIFAWAPEIGTSQDGFWPPRSRITPLAAEHLSMNLWLSRISGFWPVNDSLVVDYQGEDSALVEVNALLSNPGLVAGTEVSLRVENPGPGLIVLDSLALFPRLEAGSLPLRAENALRFRFAGNLAAASVVLALYNEESRLRSFSLELARRVAVDFDLNADGKLNVFDLLSMLEVLSAGSPTDEQIKAYDLSGDGSFNIFDLLELLKELSRNPD